MNENRRIDYATKRNREREREREREGGREGVSSDARRFESIIRFPASPTF
jgi:hypothetical protein